jgi:hypothetical protein
MKRDIIMMALVITVVGIALCMFNGCADPTAKAEGGDGGEASIKGAEVDANVSVGAVATTIEAPYTASEMIKDLLSDWFWRVLLIIAGLLVWWDWRNGNLHPAKPKHKKET